MSKSSSKGVKDTPKTSARSPTEPIGHTRERAITKKTEPGLSVYHPHNDRDKGEYHPARGHPRRLEGEEKLDNAAVRLVGKHVYGDERPAQRAQLHPVAGDRRRKHVGNDMREVSTQKRAGLATSIDLLSEPP